MEVHPNSTGLKVLLATLPFLFWVSCVADTAFVKAPERGSPDNTIVRKSEDSSHLNPLNRATATQKGVEHMRPSPSHDELQKPTQAAPSTEKGERTPVARHDGVEKTGDIAASPHTENKEAEYADPEKKQKTISLASARQEHQRPISPLDTPPLCDKTPQSTSPPIIDKEKIAPYPIEVEEEEELPRFLPLEPGTTVPAPADVEEELTIISIPPLDKQEGVTPRSLAGEKPLTGKSRQSEEGVSQKPLTMEQRGAITGTDRKEEEGMFTVPPEIEETHEFVILAQSDDAQPIRVPIWLEQGRPTPSSEGNDSLEKIASIPKGKAARALSPAEGGEEEQRMPVETESRVPFSRETQKKVEQGMLDSALEFCQASNDFWEQGDLYNAIDALDQAYSLS